MKIRKIDKSLEELISGACYLGSGASKEAYEKNGIIYKVPRGRYLIQDSNIGEDLYYPSTMDEIDSFLDMVDRRESALVWPLGQFATEIVIWEAIKQLESEGLEIGCLARIEDYYLDKNNVIVIEQEKANYNDDWESKLWDEMYKELRMLEPILEERFNIILRDVRDGNCGVGADGKLKLFDFGISITTLLDEYDSYSNYYDCSLEGESCDYNSYESY